MFSIVKVNENILKGDVVTWDETSQSFVIATSQAAPLGVADEDARDIDGQVGKFAAVKFAGLAFAKASRVIPISGGEMQVENGKVFVDNTANGSGIICPLPFDQSEKQPGDLVLVHIR